MADVPWRLAWTGTLFVALVALADAQQNKGDRCIILSDGSIGVCDQVSSCLEFVRQQIKSGVTPTICNRSDKLICCARSRKIFRPNAFQPNVKPVSNRRPPESPSKWYEINKRISERMCDLYSSSVTQVLETLPLLVDGQPEVNTVAKCNFNNFPLIVAGEEATPGEFPHMAAVGFPSDSGVRWLCGGTLISDRFVVTVAHCAYSRETDSEPSVVRLGAHDLQAYEESARDYSISTITTHPDYRKSAVYNDIALLKLVTTVSFSDFVRPACLWEYGFIKESTAVATGWGRTAYKKNASSVLLKVVLNLIDSQTCQDMVQAQPTKKFSQLVNQQLCAGDTKEKKKDTCQGDSGGPLVLKKSDNACISYLIGVTSFGKTCADGFPGIYTRISSYVPWIEGIVWPAEGEGVV